jgi:hypothetical protein
VVSMIALVLMPAAGATRTPAPAAQAASTKT